MRSDCRVFAFLASDPTIEEVRKKLGDPDEVVSPGSEMIPNGWPLPNAKRGMEIWVYSSFSGRNFYVHINSKIGRVDYVFSSSS